jgi:hypothetical protein
MEGIVHPVIVDFSLRIITNGLLNSKAFKHILEKIKIDSDQGLEALKHELLQRNVLPIDAEIYPQKTFQELQGKINPSRLRELFYLLQNEVIPQEIERLDLSITLDEHVKAAQISDLERATQILNAEKPFTMIEAVKDFVELGPCGGDGESNVVACLADQAERVALYQQQPSCDNVDDLILDPRVIGSEELRDHPERIRGKESDDNDEVRKNFGPEPM